MDPERRSIEIRLIPDPEKKGPGTLEGTLLTYNERASDRPERFEAGSLQWPAEGVVLREMHDRGRPITRFVPEVEGNRVLLRAVLPDTQRARDAATLVKNGTLRGLSVEFWPDSEAYEGDMRIIKQARLVGAGLVDDPAYSGSLVNVRNKPSVHSAMGKRPWLYV